MRPSSRYDLAHSRRSQGEVNEAYALTKVTSVKLPTHRRHLRKPLPCLGGTWGLWCHRICLLLAAWLDVMPAAVRECTCTLARRGGPASVHETFVVKNSRLVSHRPTQCFRCVSHRVPTAPMDGASIKPTYRRTHIGRAICANNT